MTKLYDVTLSEVIKERLGQLEEKPKPPAKVPARIIIERFREAARQAVAKGYSVNEICQIAQEAGLEVSVATLQTYLRSRKAKKKVPAGQRKAEPAPMPPAPRLETLTVENRSIDPLPSHAGYNEDN